MYRLIYTSHTPRVLPPNELEGILNGARRNNLRDEITGMLIYHEGSVLQLLEGPDAAVKACFQRILRDRRHERCTRIIEESAASRIFSDWRMAYEDYGALSGVQQKQFVRLKDFASRYKEEALVGHPAASAIVLAFLSSFRTLDLAV
jgi:hypothetical protein